jgi:hypothetical protein
VLASDGAAATRVRWAIAGLSFRFGAELLRVVASLADDGLVLLAVLACDFCTARFPFSQPPFHEAQRRWET